LSRLLIKITCGNPIKPHMSSATRMTVMKRKTAATGLRKNWRQKYLLGISPIVWKPREVHHGCVKNSFIVN
jgi:hypothetical protein